MKGFEPAFLHTSFHAALPSLKVPPYTQYRDWWSLVLAAAQDRYQGSCPGGQVSRFFLKVLVKKMPVTPIQNSVLNPDWPDRQKQLWMPRSTLAGTGLR